MRMLKQKLYKPDNLFSAFEFIGNFDGLQGFGWQMGQCKGQADKQGCFLLCILGIFLHIRCI